MERWKEGDSEGISQFILFSSLSISSYASFARSLSLSLSVWAALSFPLSLSHTHTDIHYLSLIDQQSKLLITKRS